MARAWSEVADKSVTASDMLKIVKYALDKLNKYTPDGVWEPDVERGYDATTPVAYYPDRVGLDIPFKDVELSMAQGKKTAIAVRAIMAEFIEQEKVKGGWTINSTKSISASNPIMQEAWQKVWGVDTALPRVRSIRLRAPNSLLLREVLEKTESFIKEHEKEIDDRTLFYGGTIGATVAAR